MENKLKKIAEILQEASEAHGSVFRIVEGNDPDWASWYSDWLINLSQLPKMFDNKLIRSELTYMLVKLDKEYNYEKPAEKWEEFYARNLLKKYEKI